MKILLVIMLFLQGCSLSGYIGNSESGCKFQKAMIDDTEIKLIKADCVESLLLDEMGGDDIEGWDINLEEVKNVYINEHREGTYPFKLDRSEWTRLLSAFNSIEKQDIYWEYTSDGLTGGFGGSVEVNLKNGEIIQIGYDPTCALSYRGLFYFTSYHLRYYDVIRVLSLKYGFDYIDWENSYMYFPGSDGYGVAVENNVIVVPMKNINDVRNILHIDGESYDFTFEDVIYQFDEIGLNDVIKLDDMLIKIIEIKENQRVTAIAVEFTE